MARVANGYVQLRCLLEKQGVSICRKRNCIYLTIFVECFGVILQERNQSIKADSIASEVIFYVLVVRVVRAAAEKWAKESKVTEEHLKTRFSFFI